MELSLLLEYGWVLLILICLEGILSADNAVVMAVMVKHLPKEQQKKALFYGLLGAFVFRFASLFIITILVQAWQVQAMGAAYLLYLSVHHLIKTMKRTKKNAEQPKQVKSSSFWMTVLKVEIADIAFAVDSMLAAVALAMTLTPAGLFHIGGMDGGQFIVVFLGGMFGLILIRFAATWFIKVLEKYPTLETAAYLIVGWVGVKLAVLTLAHPKVNILDETFPASTGWKLTFWIVLIGIALSSYIVSLKKAKNMTNVY
ncbi:TerC family protein [Bacillus chungangensis]|uniref:YkoY family integral membrane protein n=1 Tax=Bacillus chungangensis TaxID=587633 RepID=A0ABT9WNN0_9BACI|nr:TerC family protein [Bacillus chungangensis]MDQ0174572.1 YkoY family integral membrane protein [Bacillus chungangensis]